MGNRRIAAVMAAVAMAAAGKGSASEITITGTVSAGSGMGLISDGKTEYSYAGNTRHLAILNKGCPTRMGEETPCTVRFRAENGSAVDIVSARAPGASGNAINKPGSVFDASVCEQRGAVGYDVKQGCTHFADLSVQILSVEGETAALKWNGLTRYALSQRVTVNCHGTAVSLASYLGRNFPPGMKAC